LAGSVNIHVNQKSGTLRPDALIDFIMDVNEFNVAFINSFGYDPYDSGA
jgi:hypothetical protein